MLKLHFHVKGEGGVYVLISFCSLCSTWKETGLAHKPISDEFEAVCSSFFYFNVGMN